MTDDADGRRADLIEAVLRHASRRAKGARAATPAGFVGPYCGHQAAPTGRFLDAAPAEKNPDRAIAKRVDGDRPAIDRTEPVLDEPWTGEVADPSMIGVASRQLRQPAVARNL